MKPITMEQVLKTFKEYFLMTVGMMLYSFAWIGCIMAVPRAFRACCAMPWNIGPA